MTQRVTPPDITDCMPRSFGDAVAAYCKLIAMGCKPCALYIDGAGAAPRIYIRNPQPFLDAIDRTHEVHNATTFRGYWTEWEQVMVCCPTDRALPYDNDRSTLSHFSRST